MFGDLYTILLLLDKYSVDTKNLILNFSYWELATKNPTYWFKHYLKELDSSSYEKMVETKAISRDSLWDNMKSEIYHLANKNIKILGYSQFVTNKIKTLSGTFLNESQPVLAVWSTKSELPSVLGKPENKWYFSDKKFNLTETSSQVYFLEKIIEFQRGKNSIFILNAMNDKLLPSSISEQGFRDNITAIEKYFYEKNLNLVNYNGKIDYTYFSDHVHLLPEGYKFIANDLINRIDKES